MHVLSGILLFGYLLNPSWLLGMYRFFGVFIDLGKTSGRRRLFISSPGNIEIFLDPQFGVENFHEFVMPTVQIWKVEGLCGSLCGPCLLWAYSIATLRKSFLEFCHTKFQVKTNEYFRLKRRSGGRERRPPKRQFKKF